MPQPFEDEIEAYRRKHEELQERLGQIEKEHNDLREESLEGRSLREVLQREEQLKKLESERLAVEQDLVKNDAVWKEAKELREMALQQEKATQSGTAQRGPEQEPVNPHAQQRDREALLDAAGGGLGKSVHEQTRTETGYAPQPHADADHTPGLDPVVAGAVLAGAAVSMYRDMQDKREQMEWALHQKQMQELQELKSEWGQQRAAAAQVKSELGLDDAGRKAFERNEFVYTAEKVNQKYMEQIQERKDANAKDKELERQMSQEWDSFSREVCRVEAEREVDANNRQHVERYSEKLSGEHLDPEAREQRVAAYGSRLNQGAPAEIEQKTTTLQQQTFPQIAQDGRALDGPSVTPPGLNSPGQAGPGGGGPGHGGPG